MQDLLNAKLQLVTGKGGVGKSVVAASLALALSRGGTRSVLLATLGGVDDTSRLLGCMPLGMNEREVLPGVWAVAMTGESARLEYATKVLKFERMARLVFQNKLVRNLLDFVPGLNEVNQLGKLHWHLTDGGSGSRRFDHVVLEAPASGHAITLLRSPAIIHRASPPGPMRRDCGRILNLLRDPTMTRVHVVTLPAAMACNEAAELSEALRSRAEAPMGMLICNRVQSMPPEGEVPAAEADWRAFMEVEAERTRRHHHLLGATEARTGMPRLDLPERPGSGPRVVEALSALLEAST